MTAPPDRHQWREMLTSDRELTLAARMVGIALETKWTNAASGCAWPAVETIAEFVGLSVRCVRAGLRALEECGYLRIHAGGGRGRANRYELTWPDRPAEVVQLRDRAADREPRPKPCAPASVHRLEAARKRRQSATRNPANRRTPYREHPNEHPNRAPMRVAIPATSISAERWRRWLADRGAPPLDPAMDGAGAGQFAVPLTDPPDHDDQVEQAVAQSWLATRGAGVANRRDEQDRRGFDHQIEPHYSSRTIQVRAG